MADGRWQMQNGRWQMADGRWQMARCRWQMQMADGNGVADGRADGRWQDGRWQMARWQMTNGLNGDAEKADHGVLALWSSLTILHHHCYLSARFTHERDK